MLAGWSFIAQVGHINRREIGGRREWTWDYGVKSYYQSYGVTTGNGT